jgi:hypothetical protein
MTATIAALRHQPGRSVYCRRILERSIFLRVILERSEGSPYSAFTVACLCRAHSSSSSWSATPFLSRHPGAQRRIPVFRPCRCLFFAVNRSRIGCHRGESALSPPTPSLRIQPIPNPVSPVIPINPIPIAANRSVDSSARPTRRHLPSPVERSRRLLPDLILQSQIAAALLNRA